MKTIYNKLVRDKIPDNILYAGKKCCISQLNLVDDIEAALIDKLAEEVCELKLAQTNEEQIEEMADIAEVLTRLVQLRSRESEVERIREEKKQANGGFEKGIFLEYVED